MSKTFNTYDLIQESGGLVASHVSRVHVRDYKEWITIQEYILINGDTMFRFEYKDCVFTTDKEGFDNGTSN